MEQFQFYTCWSPCSNGCTHACLMVWSAPGDLTANPRLCNPRHWLLPRRDSYSSLNDRSFIFCDLLHIPVLYHPCCTLSSFQVSASQPEDHSQGRNPGNDRIHTEYTAGEETTILPKTVLLTLFAGGLVLDGTALWRHNFTESRQNAAPRKEAAKS